MNNEFIKCQFCGQSGFKWLKQHERQCILNLNRTSATGHKGSNQFISGNATTHSLETKDKISKSQIGRIQSEETKQKISKSRIQFLSENPEKVPYLLNHYSKGESFPEKYWREILEKYNINFISEYRISLYSLDFAIIDKMIDLEIDGEQHYIDNRIIKSNLKRTDYLESLGWNVIRIRWSEYQKLNFEKRQWFVDDLIKQFRVSSLM